MSKKLEAARDALGNVAERWIHGVDDTGMRDLEQAARDFAAAEAEEDLGHRPKRPYNELDYAWRRGVQHAIGWLRAGGLAKEVGDEAGK